MMVLRDWTMLATRHHSTCRTVPMLFPDRFKTIYVTMIAPGPGHGHGHVGDLPLLPPGSEMSI